MRIDKIEIENFRLFEEAEFTFSPGFNLLVGENGSGKSSVLNAVAVALGGWLLSITKNEERCRGIEGVEIREYFIDKRFEKAEEVRISVNALLKGVANKVVEQKQLKWTRIKQKLENHTRTFGGGNLIKSLGGGLMSIGGRLIKTPGMNTMLESHGKNIIDYINDGNQLTLPLIAFYECDRLWKEQEPINTVEAAKKQFSRFDAYTDCFHTGTNQKLLAEWLLKYELAALQQSKVSPELQSIRTAATSAVEGCTGIRYDIEQGRILVAFGHEVIPFEHLSDGQRTIIALFCDIARRAALLNPHLGDEVNAETPGVVLIDELDLHLHPKWQRNIIENLRTAFPKIQFVCTTHSPFLIQSVRSSEELIMLSGQPLAEYGSHGIEDISRNMGVERPEIGSRYEAEKEAAKQYLQLLDEAAGSPEEKQEAYKQQLASLIGPYADNAAYQAFLELKYATKLGDKDAAN